MPVLTPVQPFKYQRTSRVLQEKADLLQPRTGGKNEPEEGGAERTHSNKIPTRT